MKKVLFTLLFALPVMAMAQQSANVDVSTTIQGEFTIVQAEDLVFGTVRAEDVVTVNPVNNTSTNAGATAQRAQLDINNGFGTLNISISGLGFSSNSITLPRTTGTAGAANLTVNLTYAVSEDGGTNVTSFTDLTSVPAAVDRFYIGGTFTAPDAASAGNVYSGVITISAVYN